MPHWKTPHGSDAMPEIIVKIIGGKHFRYLVEKPKIKHNESLKTETQTAFQKPMADNTKQMSRDLPAPTDPTDEQTNDNPVDEEESKAPGSNRKSENNQKLLTGAFNSRFLDGNISGKTNVHCSSVPTGDKSLSYLHGFPRRTHRDRSWEHMAKAGSDQPEDVVQRPSGMTREDSFLLSLVRRELKLHPLSPSLLDKLQKELKTLDPISAGFLLPSQLSYLFLKHKIPLQLPTVKLLCQRFSRKGSPEMVDYGKLLMFLKDVTSGDLQQKEAFVDSIPETTQSHSNQRQSVSPQDSSLLSKVNKNLLEILEMVLRTTNGKLSLENLSLSFRKADCNFSGCLPLPKVRAICGKHGLYLTLSLLETLLSYQDLGYQGEIKWQKFVELLNRASDLCDLPVGKNEAKATPGEIDVPETSQSKAEHVKIPEEMLQPENPPAETPAPQDAVSSLKIRPVSQPFVSPAMMKEPGQGEIWIDRFRKLENALYLCDLSNTGVLQKERAKRLIHNYNLIYNLSLSPRKIDQALRKFRVGDNMLLEPALRYLKEL